MNMTTYPFKLGGYQCFVINDDFMIFSADYLVGAEMTQEQLARIELDFKLDPDRIKVSTNNLLINTGRKNILIDAGSGERPYPGEKEGKLLQNLDSLGLNPGNIDEIIITHSD